MSKLVARVRQLHDQFFALVSYLQSPFLLFVRLYWGWQLAQSGWGKLHHLPNVTEFFASLNLPMPAQMAVFIACVEFFGGIFLALGLFSRITGLVLTVNVTMAYVIGDREALIRVPHRLSDRADFWRGQDLGGHRADIFLWFHTGEASEFSYGLIARSPARKLFTVIQCSKPLWWASPPARRLPSFFCLSGEAGDREGARVPS